jgi:hypothetical protein
MKSWPHLLQTGGVLQCVLGGFAAALLLYGEVLYDWMLCGRLPLGQAMRVVYEPRAKSFRGSVLATPRPGGNGLS